MNLHLIPSLRGFRLALLGAGLFFAACGGGGGGGASNAASISGTVATGAPLLHAEVTVKARDGTTITTRTSATDGRYVLSVKGLEAPYFVRVDDGSDGLYSVGWQPGVVNVTPLTSMAVHLYYQAHQLDLATVWNEYSSGMPVPTRAAMVSIGDQIERTLTPYLLAYGESADDFDVVTTPFAANGSGFDAVLGMSTCGFGMTSAVLGIDDSGGATGTHSETDFAVSTGTGTITATRYFDAGGGWVPNAIDVITLPLGEGEADVDAALRGVETTLQSMVDVMNRRGAALTGADLMPFFDAGYLNDGLDAAAETTHLAAGVEGTFTFLGAMRVVSFDAATQRIAVKFAVKITAGGVSDVAELPDVSDDGYVFARAPDGSFKFYGNQRPVFVMVKGIVQSDYSTATNMDPDPHPDLQLLLEARAPAGQIGYASVYGVIPPGGWQTVGLSLTNVDDLGEHYTYQHSWGSDVPSPGWPYMFMVWMAGFDDPFVYVLPLASVPEPGLRLAGYDDMPYADCLGDPDYRTIGFVHPGTPLDVEWAPPTTTAAAKISLSARVHAGDAWEQVDSDSPISRTATSGKITIPTTVMGQAVTGVYIFVIVTGKNGEEVQLWDFIGQWP
jgi:hypothetical protein